VSALAIVARLCEYYVRAAVRAQTGGNWMKLATVKIAIAGALMSVALTACVVAPAPGYGEVVAYEAPPPVQYEAVGVAPAPGYFWIGGAWFWESGRYAWHPGRWERERAGYRWAPHQWARAGNGWRMRPGHWERR
jgi:hypothetical protein